MAIPVEQVAINLAVALGLSAVIGFERQWRNRLAGLRTNTLVALGAATFLSSPPSSPEMEVPPASPHRSSRGSASSVLD